MSRSCRCENHTAVQRAGQILSTALITAGLVVLADAILTLTWQEPVSAAYGKIQQSRAGDQLEELEAEFPTAADIAAVQGSDVTGQARILARRFGDRIEPGDAIGRIEIDGIGLDAVLMHGTDTATLQRGPAHYEQTPLPGQGKTAGIAGHRTTYLAPFRDIDQVRKGDRVRVELPYGAFTYTVERSEVVDPSEVQIVDPVGYDRVVLTACHPLYSAAQRYAIFARLTRIESFAVSGTGAWVAP
jgi:sortase A